MSSQEEFVLWTLQRFIRARIDRWRKRESSIRVIVKIHNSNVLLFLIRFHFRVPYY